MCFGTIAHAGIKTLIDNIENENKKEYIYPRGLKSQAKIYFWYLKDIAVIAIMAAISVLIAAKIRSVVPLIIPAVYAFLTLRMEEAAIIDYIKRFSRFFGEKQEYKK